MWIEWTLDIIDIKFNKSEGSNLPQLIELPNENIGKKFQESAAHNSIEVNQLLLFACHQKNVANKYGSHSTHTYHCCGQDEVLSTQWTEW